MISAISGIATAFFVVSWLLAVRQSAYMLLDVFLMLGTLVPIMTGYIVFSEPIGIRQIMAVALSLHSYFSTMSASLLDSMRLYPLNQGASRIISTLMASIFFKEKLTLKAVIGIASSFAVLLIINL